MARILIVDDDVAVQATLRIVLERASHSIVVTADGGKGLQALREGRFDLLIVDIHMPGMDGLEIIRAVHKDLPELPIIVISGSAFASELAPSPDFLSMGIKLGAISSLKKPFKPGELLATVNNCLNRPEKPAE
jgi:CheY-like chemotaxis protein